MPRWDGNKGDGGNAPAGPKPPPQVVDKRCQVCTSQYRKDMERLIVLSLSYSEIARYFEALGETITRKSLSNHHAKHMWVETAAIRSLIEDRAREALKDVEEHKGFLLEKRGLLEVMLQQGYHSIMSGNTQVEPKDLLAVVEKLERMEAAQEAVAVDELLKDFNDFADAVKALVPEDMWAKIFEQYELNVKARKGQTLEAMMAFEVPDPPKEIGE